MADLRDNRRDQKRDDYIRVNHQIRAPKIRVVVDDGEMLGVMSPFEALKEAEKRGLDLVEISPKATPPVCKITDYGKFKYEQKKKAHSSRKTHVGTVVKEVTLAPSTDVHDVNFKVRNSIRFLDEGYRVKISVRFRGREMAHPEIGHKQMAKIVDMLKDHGVPEANPKMEGKILAAVFVPLTAAVKAKLAKTGHAPDGAPGPSKAPAGKNPGAKAPSVKETVNDALKVTGKESLGGLAGSLTATLGAKTEQKSGQK